MMGTAVHSDMGLFIICFAFHRVGFRVSLRAGMWDGWDAGKAERWPKGMQWGQMESPQGPNM